MHLILDGGTEIFCLRYRLVLSGIEGLIPMRNSHEPHDVGWGSIVVRPAAGNDANGSTATARVLEMASETLWRF